MAKTMSFTQYRKERSATMHHELDDKGFLILTPTAQTRAFEKANSRNIQFQGVADLNSLFGVYR